MEPVVIHLFNNTWLCRYLRLQKVVFDNRSEFKWDFTPLLKDFGIKLVLTTIENPQGNAPAEQVYQVILNILVTKDISRKVFNYIDTGGETLAYKAWEIRAFYHCTI